MFWVYILLLANGQLYTGYTSNVHRRLAEHKNGSVESTKHRLPVKLVHQEIYVLESDARRREKFLKTTDGKRLLKQQIRDVLIQEKVLLVDMTET